MDWLVEHTSRYNGYFRAYSIQIHVGIIWCTFLKIGSYVEKRIITEDNGIMFGTREQRTESWDSGKWSTRQLLAYCFTVRIHINYVQNARILGYPVNIPITIDGKCTIKHPLVTENSTVIFNTLSISNAYVYSDPK